MLDFPWHQQADATTQRYCLGSGHLRMRLKPTAFELNSGHSHRNNRMRRLQQESAAGLTKPPHLLQFAADARQLSRGLRPAAGRLLLHFLAEQIHLNHKLWPGNRRLARADQGLLGQHSTHGTQQQQQQ